MRLTRGRRATDTKPVRHQIQQSAPCIWRHRVRGNGPSSRVRTSCFSGCLFFFLTRRVATHLESMKNEVAASARPNGKMTTEVRLGEASLHATRYHRGANRRIRDDTRPDGHDTPSRRARMGIVPHARPRISQAVEDRQGRLPDFEKRLPDGVVLFFFQVQTTKPSRTYGRGRCLRATGTPHEAPDARKAVTCVLARSAGKASTSHSLSTSLVRPSRKAVTRVLTP